MGNTTSSAARVVEIAGDILPGELLDEQGFAKLIASDERLCGAVSRKKILDLAVLVDALSRAKHRAWNHLQGIRIRDTITLEPFRFFAVEHREHDASWP